MYNIARDRPDLLRRIARRIPGGMAAGRWLRARLVPAMRAVERTRREFPGELFQPWPDTAEDRYPELFDALAERLTNLPEPRILSFGCSTGEEVRALRRRMPDAWITGVDANRRSLDIARRADGHPRSAYIHAATVAPPLQFDAILALAVFRVGQLETDRPPVCTDILPFVRYANGIAMLDAVLRPGGWLAVWNSHFRFCDTPVAAGYRTDPFRMPGGPQTLVYGPDDRLIADGADDEVLFQRA